MDCWAAANAGITRRAKATPRKRRNVESLI